MIFVHFMLNTAILLFVGLALVAFVNNLDTLDEITGFRTAVVYLLTAIVFCLMALNFK